MKRIRHATEGVRAVHYESPLNAEYTLCGDVVTGDPTLFMTKSISTKAKVTCPRCITIVDAVRKETTEPSGD